MLKTDLRRFKLAAIGVIASGLLALAMVLAWPRKATGEVSVQVTGIRSAGANVVQVSVTLSNAASRAFNIVDAVDGRPWYHIAPHPELRWKYGLTLARMANTRRINLMPRATLADSFWITNPPSRFSVTVPLRDLAAEGWQGSTVRSNLLVKSLTRTLEDLEVIKPSDPEFTSLVSAARSAWVDAKLP
jgi:hypothetical protein